MNYISWVVLLADEGCDIQLLLTLLYLTILYLKCLNNSWQVLNRCRSSHILKSLTPYSYWLLNLQSEILHTVVMNLTKHAMWTENRACYTLVLTLLRSWQKIRGVQARPIWVNRALQDSKHTNWQKIPEEFNSSVSHRANIPRENEYTLTPSCIFFFQINSPSRILSNTLLNILALGLHKTTGIGHALGNVSISCFS